MTNWLSLEDAAAAAHLPISQINEAIHAGELRAAIVSGRLLVFATWLRAWLAVQPPLPARDYRMAAAHDSPDERR